MLGYGLLSIAFADDHSPNYNPTTPAPVPAPAPIPAPPPAPAPPLSGLDGSRASIGLSRTRKEYLKEGVKCNALYQRPFYIDKVGSSKLDIEYNRAVREYVDKFINYYRPEPFFTRLLWNIERSERLLKEVDNIDSHELDANQKLLKEWLPKQISRQHKKLLQYHHFDESIKVSFLELAEQKYSPSFYCLGFVYENGIGQKVDYAEAWAWFYTATAVDGINARTNLNRVSRLLSVNDEVKAKGLADKYIRQYTDFNETPSVVIIK